MKIGKFLVYFFFVLCNISLMNAQNEQEKTPLWITLMNNPKVNYYEAVKEFTNYWENKEKPNEENEVFRERKVEKKKAIKYAFEYKKFLQWQKKVLPFIKEDGTIATPEERKQMWEEEKNNRLSDK